VTSLTFYGGVNEIGGNKILLEEKDQTMETDEELEKRLISLIDSEKFEELRKECEKTLEKEPRNYVAMGYLTNALIELDSIEHALDYCNKFLNIYPNHPII